MYLTSRWFIIVGIWTGGQLLLVFLFLEYSEGNVVTELCTYLCFLTPAFCMHSVSINVVLEEALALSEEILFVSAINFPGIKWLCTVNRVLWLLLPNIYPHVHDSTKTREHCIFIMQTWHLIWIHNNVYWEFNQECNHAVMSV